MSYSVNRWLLAICMVLLFSNTVTFCPQTAAAGEPGPSLTEKQPHLPTKNRPRALENQILTPDIRIGPPVHHGAKGSDKQLALLQNFIRDSDQILSSDWSDQGAIHSTWLGHVLISQGEELLVDLKQSASPGTTFMVYRPVMPLTDPHNGEDMGMLADNLGTAKITGERTGTLWHARITKARQEMQVGDRLLHDRSLPMDFNGYTHISAPMHEKSIHGRVLHISDNMEMAGANQVIVVGVGRRERAVRGMVLTISQQRHSIPAPGQDSSNNTETQTSMHSIGDATLFQIGEKASFALLGTTIEPIHRGDEVSNY